MQLLQQPGKQSGLGWRDQGFGIGGLEGLASWAPTHTQDSELFLEVICVTVWHGAHSIKACTRPWCASQALCSSRSHPQLAAAAAGCAVVAAGMASHLMGALITNR